MTIAGRVGLPLWGLLALRRSWVSGKFGNCSQQESDTRDRGWGHTRRPGRSAVDGGALKLWRDRYVGHILTSTCTKRKRSLWHDGCAAVGIVAVVVAIDANRKDSVRGRFHSCCQTTVSRMPKIAVCPDVVGLLSDTVRGKLLTCSV